MRKAESFQLYASSKGRYSCQTRLLGLQADLIMIILNSPRSKALSLTMLSDLQKTCKYL
ncbi:hypothetical protein EV05_1160 [Prochlorococcus sp. MIT 0601]|nr:hypothetical protein EV05_1160 [Prochlorococcus sp. MIT 0601]